MPQFTLKNKKKLTVRPLKAADYDPVQEYLKLLGTETIFTNQYPGRPKREREATVRQYEDTNNFYLGAFDGKKVVGIISAGIVNPTHPWGGTFCEFGVHMLEKYTGQGLGKYFMKSLEKWARSKKMRQIKASVRHTNLKGINLYLKSGFLIEGLKRDTAYIHNEWHHEYIISKDLT
ncbi:MAG: GNAT family N-acetyltransferase [Lactobacillales bacterium]|jgi:RimJ/RimL family protein N-acetyltransferase|nr:GNAT family N-acetyltransferase [Lactobacillales bacterium]